MKLLNVKSAALAALLVDASAYGFVVLDGEAAQIAFTQQKQSAVEDNTFHLWSEETVSTDEEDVSLPDVDETAAWISAFSRELNGFNKPWRHKWHKDHGKDRKEHPAEKPDDGKVDTDPFAPSNYWDHKCHEVRRPENSGENVKTSWWDVALDKVGKGRKHRHCGSSTMKIYHEQGCSLMDYIRRKPGCWGPPNRDGGDKHPHHPHPPPGKRPKHPPPHRRPDCGRGGGHKGHDLTNYTIFQLLEKSKYTTKIFKLVSNDDELTKILNSTDAKENITFFAPTDSAFEKIPKHGKHPPEEFIAHLLRYHVAKGSYTARRVFLSHTIPTLFEDDGIGGEPQRIRSSWGRLNLFSKLSVTNVFSKNGIIHGIDHILVPPPPAHAVLEVLPGEFSTLVNALYKTGLHEGLASNDTRGTLFAPTNNHFKRLGPKALAFLFSKFGEKYLKALLQYHIVPDQILYSDHYSKPDDDNDDDDDSVTGGRGDVPKGKFHTDLKTSLKEKSISVDISRWGRWISYKTNGIEVRFQDAIVHDGVIHVPGKILIPPRSEQPPANEQNVRDEHICMTVEMLKERLEPYVEK